MFSRIMNDTVSTLTERSNYLYLTFLAGDTQVVFVQVLCVCEGVCCECCERNEAAALYMVSTYQVNSDEVFDPVNPRLSREGKMQMKGTQLNGIFKY